MAEGDAFAAGDAGVFCDWLFASCALFSLIAFLRWFHRALANLQSKLSYTLPYTPGWSVAFFFIPVVNLFMPCNAMLKLHKHTARLFALHGLAAGAAPSSKRIGWWWAVLLIAMYNGHLLSGFSVGSVLFDGVRVCALAWMVSSVFTIALIRGYARAEPVLAAIPDWKAGSPIPPRRSPPAEAACA